MIELAKVLNCGFYRRPCLAEKWVRGGPCQGAIQKNPPAKFGIEIFPVIGILPARLVDGYKRIAFRNAKIVRHGADLLALMGDRLAGLLCLPYPQSVFRPLLGYGVSKFPEYLFIDRRPKFQQRQRRIETNIECAVIRIVETLEQCESWWCLCIRAWLAAPVSSSIVQGVILVAMQTSILQGLT